MLRGGAAGGPVIAVYDPLSVGLVSPRSLALEFAKHFGGERLQLGAMLPRVRR